MHAHKIYSTFYSKSWEIEVEFEDVRIWVGVIWIKDWLRVEDDWRHNDYWLRLGRFDGGACEIAKEAGLVESSSIGSVPIMGLVK